MRETEITVRVFDENNVIDQKLVTAGFKATGRFYMFDRYYTHLINYKNASYECLLKHSVIIRQIAEKTIRSMILFKDKSLDNDGNVISEQKIVCSIENCDAAAKIYDSAGFTKWCEVRNHSTKYVQGEIELVVQTIEGLGTFIEFEEYPSIKDMSDSEKFLSKLYASNTAKSFSKCAARSSSGIVFSL